MTSVGRGDETEPARETEEEGAAECGVLGSKKRMFREGGDQLRLTVPLGEVR